MSMSFDVFGVRSLVYGEDIQNPDVDFLPVFAKTVSGRQVDEKPAKYHAPVDMEDMQREDARKQGKRLGAMVRWIGDILGAMCLLFLALHWSAPDLPRTVAVLWLIFAIMLAGIGRGLGALLEQGFERAPD